MKQNHINPLYLHIADQRTIGPLEAGTIVAIFTSEKSDPVALLPIERIYPHPELGSMIVINGGVEYVVKTGRERYRGRTYILAPFKAERLKAYRAICLESLGRNWEEQVSEEVRRKVHEKIGRHKDQYSIIENDLLFDCFEIIRTAIQSLTNAT